MSGLKNSTKKNWGITISPPQSSYESREQLEECINKILSKFPRHVSVYECGTTGSHLHSHMYVESDKALRRDTLKASLLNILHKMLKVDSEFDNVLLHLSPAENPTYYVSTYMTKESQPTFVGIDKDKYNVKNIDRNLNQKASQLRNVTYRNLQFVIEQAIQDGFVPNLQSKKTVITELTKYLFKNNYDVTLLIKDASHCLCIFELVLGEDKFLKIKQENNLERNVNGCLVI